MPPSNTELAASSFDEFTHADGDSSRSKSRSASGIGEKICYPQNELSGGVTFSRRIARYLSKYKWYYPQRDNPDVDLDTSWDYFEHVTLPRRFCDEQGVNNGGYEKAPKGEMERPTALYPINAPQDELADFGIGVGMYFATIKALVVMCIIAGAINIPVMMHFASEDYSTNQEDLAWAYKFSAVCEEHEYVPCPDCGSDDWASKDKFREEIAEDGAVYTFIRRNACILELASYGWFTVATIGAFLLFFLYLGKLQHNIEVAYDENEQTCTDYSIRVTNPPSFVLDPEEYTSYFEEVTGAPVSVVTIALNNRSLMKALIYRRKLLKMLTEVRSVASIQGDEDCESVRASPFRSYESKPILWSNSTHSFASFKEKMLLSKLSKTERSIEDLYERKYEVAAVYVTFEKEFGQRIALLEFSVSYLESIGFVEADNTGSTGPAPFYGVKLQCEEPPEPDSVRWVDLGMSPCKSLLLKAMTLLATFSIVLLNALLINATKGEVVTNKVGYSAVLISLSNIVIPEICKVMNNQEMHDTDGSSQMGLYFKITVVRWVNTALLIYILIDHTNTIRGDSSGTLVRVTSILWAEMIITPLIRAADLYGTFSKHFLAPRCTNQTDMNLNFQGTFYFLAERYTDATKIFFLAVFYAAILPGALFKCGVILSVYYFNDIFCMTRVWKPAPLMGTELTKFSRKYFFSTAFYALCLMTAYWWGGFPYDNMCPCEQGSTENGCNQLYPDGLSFLNTNYTDSKSYAIISNETSYYYYCRQDFIRMGTFPPVPDVASHTSWMTNDQLKMSELVGWGSVFVLIVVVWKMFGYDFYYNIMHMHQSTYNPFESRDQNIDFSCVDACYAYVPQLVNSNFEYPLLICDISSLDTKLISWSDPIHGYENWNITHDVPRKKTSRDDPHSYRNGTNDNRNPVFSIIEHYPPEWRLDEMKEERD